MEAAQIVWLVLVVLFIIAEAVTAALVSVWFCLGGMAALVVALVWPGAYIAQGAVFLAVSAFALLLLRPVAHKVMGNRRVATNADANIGKVCQVINEIQPERFGRVKLEGLEWTAKSYTVLPVGAWCRVDAIEGVKLVVSPLPPTVEVPPPSSGM